MQESGRRFKTGCYLCLLVQESGRWFRTGSCLCLLVQESGHWFRTGNRCCRKVAGAGLVAAGAELVSVGICWCRKVIAGAGLEVASVGKWPPVQEW